MPTQRHNPEKTAAKPRLFTVSAAAPRLIVGLLTQSREEQENIYREAKLDPVLLDNVDSRIAYKDFQRFAAITMDRAHDPHFGLRATASFFPSVLDVVSFAMLASATLLQALETLAQYSPLLDESIQVSVRKEASVVTLTLKGRMGRPLPVTIDAGLAVLLRILRLLSAGRPVNVHAARFSYPPPKGTTLHAAILGCSNMTFAEQDDAIAFLLADIDQPIPRPSKVVSTLLNEVARSELDFLKQASLVSIKTREVISRGLGGSAATLSSVATGLQMSPRALQRALEHEGVNFRELVNDIHRQHAHLRLRYSSKSIKEIAFELGFNEQRSFHRACIRWFGESPAAYRHLPPKSGR